MDAPTTGALSKSRKTLYIYSFLRVIQVVSTVVAGFEVCWLVWHYNNHYCALYPAQCAEFQKQWAEVPREHIWMIVACIVTLLEACLTTAYFISRRSLPNFSLIHFSSLPTMFLFDYILSSFSDRQSFALLYCGVFPDPPRFIPVEAKQCVSVQRAVVAGNICLFFSFALNIMAATIVIIEGWKKASRNILAKWRNARQAPQVVDLQEKSLDGTSGAFGLV